MPEQIIARRHMLPVYDAGSIARAKEENERYRATLPMDEQVRLRARDTRYANEGTRIARARRLRGGQ